MLLRGIDPVARVVVHTQQHGLPARARRLRTGGHLRRYPRRDAWIVDPGRQQDGRVRRMVLDLLSEHEEQERELRRPSVFRHRTTSSGGVPKQPARGDLLFFRPVCITIDYCITISY